MRLAINNQFDGFYLYNELSIFSVNFYNALEELPNHLLRLWLNPQYHSWCLEPRIVFKVEENSHATRYGSCYLNEFGSQHVSPILSEFYFKYSPIFTSLHIRGWALFSRIKTYNIFDLYAGDDGCSANAKWIIFNSFGKQFGVEQLTEVRKLMHEIQGMRPQTFEMEIASESACAMHIIRKFFESVESEWGETDWKNGNFERARGRQEN